MKTTLVSKTELKPKQLLNGWTILAFVTVIALWDRIQFAWTNRNEVNGLTTAVIGLLLFALGLLIYVRSFIYVYHARVTRRRKQARQGDTSLLASPLTTTAANKTPFILTLHASRWQTWGKRLLLALASIALLSPSILSDVGSWNARVLILVGSGLGFFFLLAVVVTMTLVPMEPDCTLTLNEKGISRDVPHVHEEVIWKDATLFAVSGMIPGNWFHYELHGTQQIIRWRTPRHQRNTEQSQQMERLLATIAERTNLPLYNLCDTAILL